VAATLIQNRFQEIMSMMAGVFIISRVSTDITFIRFAYDDGHGKLVCPWGLNPSTFRALAGLMAHDIRMHRANIDVASTGHFRVGLFYRRFMVMIMMSMFNIIVVDNRIIQ
jgi:hypothetical protein